MTVENAHWQDAGHTILGATIDGKEWSGITARHRFHGVIVASGAAIAPFRDPTAAPAPSLSAEERLACIEAALSDAGNGSVSELRADVSRRKKAALAAGNAGPDRVER